jgi:hypothetical protein
MINFYSYYSGVGLDNEAYGSVIRQLKNREYSSDLRSIEHIIKKLPRYAYRYAQFAMHERWFEAEPYIMKPPDYAYYYAKNVIKGRWSEAEPIIMANPHWAYNYAIDVIKERWLEAEEDIKKEPSLWEAYCAYFEIE